MKCFETFVQDITEARRRGDIDDVQQILSKLAKLLGMYILQKVLKSGSFEQVEFKTWNFHFLHGKLL